MLIWKNKLLFPKWTKMTWLCNVILTTFIIHQDFLSLLTRWFTHIQWIRRPHLSHNKLQLCMLYIVCELEILFERWKSGMEQKGLRVNSGKTKVMISKHKCNPQNKTGKFPCSVCLMGVGRNSILCPALPTCQSNQLCMLAM